MSGYVVLSGEVCSLAVRLNYAPQRLTLCVRAAWDVILALAAATSAAAAISHVDDSKSRPDDTHTQFARSVATVVVRASPTFFHFLHTWDTLAVQPSAPTTTTSTTSTTALRDDLDDAAALAVLITAITHPFLSATYLTPSTNIATPAPDLSTSSVAYTTLIAALEHWESHLAILAAPSYEQFLARLNARLPGSGQERAKKSVSAQLQAATKTTSGTPTASGEVRDAAATAAEGRERAVRLCQCVEAASNWSDVSAAAMYAADRERVVAGKPLDSYSAALTTLCESSFIEVESGRNRSSPPPLSSTSSSPPPQLTSCCLRRRRRSTDGMPLYVGAEEVLSVSEGGNWLLPALLQSSDGIQQIHRCDARLVPALLCALLRLASPELSVRGGGGGDRSAGGVRAEPLGPLPSLSQASLETFPQSTTFSSSSDASLITPLSRAMRCVFGVAAPASAVPLATFIVHRVLLHVIEQSAPALALWRTALQRDVVDVLQRAAALKREEVALHAHRSNSSSAQDDDDGNGSGSANSDDDNSSSGVSSRDKGAVHLNRRVVSIEDVYRPLTVRARQVHVYERVKAVVALMASAVGTAATGPARDATSPNAKKAGRTTSFDSSPSLDIAAWKRQQTASHTATAAAVGTSATARKAASAGATESDDLVDGQWLLQVVVSLLHAHVLTWSQEVPLTPFELAASVAVWSASRSDDESRLSTADTDALLDNIAASASAAGVSNDAQAFAAVVVASKTLRSTMQWFRAHGEQQRAIFHRTLACLCPRLASVPTLWTHLDSAGVLYVLTHAPSSSFSSSASPSPSSSPPSLTRREKEAEGNRNVSGDRPLPRVGRVRAASGHASPSAESVTSVAISGSNASSPTTSLAASTTAASRISFSRHSGDSSPRGDSPVPSPDRPARAVGVVVGSVVVTPAGAGAGVGAADAASRTSPQSPDTIVRGTPTRTTARLVTSASTPSWSVVHLPERLPTSVTLASATWLAGLTLQVVCPRFVSGHNRSATSAVAVAFAEWFTAALVEGLRREGRAEEMTASLFLSAPPSSSSPASVASRQRETWERRESPALLRCCVVALTALMEVMPGSVFQSPVLNRGNDNTNSNNSSSRGGVLSTNIAKSFAALSSIYFPSDTSHQSPGDPQGPLKNRGKTATTPPPPSANSDCALERDAMAGAGAGCTTAILATVPHTDVLAFLAAETAGRQLQHAYDLLRGTRRSDGGTLDVISSGGSGGGEREPSWAHVPMACEGLVQAQMSVWLLCEAVVSHPEGLPLSVETQLAIAALIERVCRLWLRHTETTQTATPPPVSTASADQLFSQLFWLLISLVDLIVHAYGAGCPLMLCHELSHAVLGATAMESAAASATLSALVAEGLDRLAPLGWTRTTTTDDETAVGPGENSGFSQLPIVLVVLAKEAACGAFDLSGEADQEEDAEERTDDGSADDLAPAAMGTSACPFVSRQHLPSVVSALLAPHEQLGVAETLCTTLALFTSPARPESSASEQVLSTHSASPWMETERGRDDSAKVSAGEGESCAGALIQRLPIRNRPALGLAQPSSPLRRGSGGRNAFDLATRVANAVGAATSGGGGAAGESALSLRAAPTTTGRLVGFIPAGRTDLGVGAAPSRDGGIQGLASDSPRAMAEAAWWMPVACQHWWATRLLDTATTNWWSSTTDTLLN